MAPSSAKAKHASSVITMPMPQTLRNSHGRRVLVATSCAVRKMPDPMIPPASSRMESVRESLRTSLVGWVKLSRFSVLLRGLESALFFAQSQATNGSSNTGSEAGRTDLNAFDLRTPTRSRYVHLIQRLAPCLMPDGVVA